MVFKIKSSKTKDILFFLGNKFEYYKKNILVMLPAFTGPISLLIATRSLASIDESLELLAKFFFIRESSRLISWTLLKGLELKPFLVLPKYGEISRRRFLNIFHRPVLALYFLSIILSIIFFLINYKNNDINFIFVSLLIAINTFSWCAELLVRSIYSSSQKYAQWLTNGLISLIIYFVLCNNISFLNRPNIILIFLNSYSLISLTIYIIENRYTKNAINYIFANGIQFFKHSIRLLFDTNKLNFKSIVYYYWISSLFINYNSVIINYILESINPSNYAIFYSCTRIFEVSQIPLKNYMHSKIYPETIKLIKKLGEHESIKVLKKRVFNISILSLVFIIITFCCLTFFKIEVFSFIFNNNYDINSKVLLYSSIYTMLYFIFYCLNYFYLVFSQGKLYFLVLAFYIFCFYLASLIYYFSNQSLISYSVNYTIPSLLTMILSLLLINRIKVKN